MLQSAHFHLQDLYAKTKKDAKGCVRESISKTVQFCVIILLLSWHANVATGIKGNNVISNEHILTHWPLLTQFITHPHTQAQTHICNNSTLQVVWWQNLLPSGHQKDDLQMSVQSEGRVSWIQASVFYVCDVSLYLHSLLQSHDSLLLLLQD